MLGCIIYFLLQRCCTEFQSWVYTKKESSPSQGQPEGQTQAQTGQEYNPWRLRPPPNAPPQARAPLRPPQPAGTLPRPPSPAIYSAAYISCQSETGLKRAVFFNAGVNGRKDEVVDYHEGGHVSTTGGGRHSAAYNERRSISAVDESKLLAAIKESRQVQTIAEALHQNETKRGAVPERNAESIPGVLHANVGVAEPIIPEESKTPESDRDGHRETIGTTPTDGDAGDESADEWGTDDDEQLPEGMGAAISEGKGSGGAGQVGDEVETNREPVTKKEKDEGVREVLVSEGELGGKINAKAQVQSSDSNDNIHEDTSGVDLNDEPDGEITEAGYEARQNADVASKKNIERNIEAPGGERHEGQACISEVGGRGITEAITGMQGSPNSASRAEINMAKGDRGSSGVDQTDEKEVCGASAENSSVDGGDLKEGDQGWH